MVTDQAGALVGAGLARGKGRASPRTFVEAHALDAKTAKRIPRKMIGRSLTMDEAATLLDRLS